MKKWKVSLVMILLLILVGNNIFANNNLIDVKLDNNWKKVSKSPIILDGEKIDTKPSSYIDNGRTMIPVRFFAENIGAKVGWNQKEKKVTITKENKSIELFINSRTMVVNGKEKQMDKGSIPKIVYYDNSYGGHTMVPLAFISEALDYEVYYDKDLKCPVVNSQKTQPDEKPDEPIEKPPVDNRNLVTDIGVIRSSSNRAKINIVGKNKLDYTYKLDKNKNMLEIDILNSKLSHMDTGGRYVLRAIDDINIRQIEFFQNGDNIKLIVLANDIGKYSFESFNNAKRQVLSFNEDLKGISLDGNKVIIPNAANLRYKNFRLNNPSRIVIDILDAELKNSGYFEIDGKDTYLDKIRISNFSVDKNYKSEDNVVRIVLDVKKGQENKGFKTYVSGKNMVIELDSPSKPNPNPEPEKPSEKPNNPGQKTIFIDAGHGGRDPGAVSKNGTREKDLTLELSLKTEKALKAAGYNVVMTRRTDTYVDYRKVGQMANNSNADLFVSYHINSAGSITSANGIETLYCPATSSNIKESNQYPFAKMVQDELIKETGARDRGVKKRPELAVLNSTKMPAVMVEAGFLTNPREENLLKTNSYQNKIVKAVVNAINKYFN